MKFAGIFLCFLILFNFQIMGCGHSTQRIPLTGDVLVDGVRINGEISLRPDEQGGGVIVTTEIKQGVYQFNETNGPVPAAYSVLIEQTTTGGKGATAAPVEAHKWTILRTLTSDQQRWDFIIDDERKQATESEAKE